MDESGNICRTNGGNHTEEQLVSCLVLTFTTLQTAICIDTHAREVKASIGIYDISTQKQKECTFSVKNWHIDFVV